MANIAARGAVETAMNLRLEWQNGQDVVDVTPHDPRAPRPPSPNRGRNVFDDWNCRIGGTHPTRYSSGEPRAIDDNKCIWVSCHQLPGRKAHESQNSRKSPGYRAEADYGKIIDGVEAPDTFLRHLAATNAGRVNRTTCGCPQRAHERRAQLIPRLLSPPHQKEIEHLATKVGRTLKRHSGPEAPLHRQRIISRDPRLR